MEQTTIEQVDQELKNSQVLVDQGAALERLMNNKDFKAIILKGYLEDEAVRLVHLKAMPAMQGPEMQKSILTMLDSIGSLSNYFRVVRQHAEQGLKGVQSLEAMREELLLEGAE